MPILFEMCILIDIRFGNLSLVYQNLAMINDIRNANKLAMRLDMENIELNLIFNLIDATVDCVLLNKTP